MSSELITAVYICPSCGEENETSVDPSGGVHQSYTEDCTVCCRPNVLRVTISGDRSAAIDAEPES